MAASNQVLQIPRVERGQFSVTIVGTTPLIMNCFSKRKQQELLDHHMMKPTSGRSAKDPQALFEEAIYRTREGHIGFPAGGIRKSCVHACRFLPTAMTQARGAFWVIGDQDNLVPVQGTPEIHQAIVRVGRGKGAPDVRFRAILYEWSITFDVLYAPRVLSMEGIVNLLEHAGFHIGIGDNRLENDGTNGRFEVSREAL